MYPPPLFVIGNYSLLKKNPAGQDIQDSLKVDCYYHDSGSAPESGADIYEFRKKRVAVNGM